MAKIRSLQAISAKIKSIINKSHFILAYAFTSKKRKSHKKSSEFLSIFMKVF